MSRTFSFWRLMIFLACFSAGGLLMDTLYEKSYLPGLSSAMDMFIAVLGAWFMVGDKNESN